MKMYLKNIYLLFDFTKKKKMENKKIEKTELLFWKAIFFSFRSKLLFTLFFNFIRNFIRK